jgi:outer membrane protein OmpA-like peptidoglycan-associated protein
VLSRHRARGVASYLAHKGIDARRLAAVGYGDSRPVAPNDSQANRARNRRIELTVTSHAGPLPPMPIRKQGTRSGLSHR